MAHNNASRSNQLNPFKVVARLLLLNTAVAICACTHTTHSVLETIPEHDWKYEFIHYQSNLPQHHADTADNIFAITDSMRHTVRAQFGRLSKQRAATALAQWIVDKQGLGLEYVFNANLTPIQAYQQRQANCLSYTLLLKQLAAALDIDIRVNSVDTPDTWSMEDNTMYFYRHVNGLLKTPTQRQVFDFTPQSYDARYPQRTISEQQALALFLNNRALDRYQARDNDQAIHLIKLAVSLSPENPDIWANAGTILKRAISRTRAKEAFEFALLLDDTHIVAASQLERLYSADGDLKNAHKYAALAIKARFGNPYYLYRQAMQEFQKKDYFKAKSLGSVANSFLS